MYTLYCVALGTVKIEMVMVEVAPVVTIFVAAEPVVSPCAFLAVTFTQYVPAATVPPVAAVASTGAGGTSTNAGAPRIQRSSVILSW